jgi:hypothetical protein
MDSGAGVNLNLPIELERLWQNLSKISSQKNEADLV